MSSTMLQLVQQVTNELGVSTPTSVVGNTNQDVIQILALMNACGYFSTSSICSSVNPIVLFIAERNSFFTMFSGHRDNPLAHWTQRSSIIDLTSFALLHKSPKEVL